MDNTQQAYLDSFNRITDFNTEQKDKIAPIDGYAVEQTNLATAIKTITDAGTTQSGKSNPDEQAVDTAKTNMAKTVYKFTSRGMVIASQAKNTSLAHALDEPETYIYKAPQNEAITRANALRNTLNDNLATLTNIKKDDIGIIDKAISAYSSLKGDPTESIKERKAFGTDVIPSAIRNGRQAVDNMYALVKSYLSDDDSDLVNLFALNMELINTAVRHTTVEITVLSEEDDEPIEAADVLDIKTEKHFSTDEEGLAELGKHLNGDDTFVISAPGRQSVTIGFNIVSRKENAFVVKLKKVLS